MHALLRNREFRRLFLGRLVTNAGDSLYAVAAAWLVWSLSGSTFYTGLALFLTMGPQLLQVFVGPLVDRFPIRKVLVVTQAAQGVLVLTIPAAHWLGVLSVPLVLAVMPVVAMLNQFVYPAQTAALPRIVETDRLTAANSLFSLAYQGVDTVFAAAAGALVAATGAVSLYLLDSLTFAVAVALFAGLRIPAAESKGDGAAGSNGYLADLKGGLRFVAATPLAWLFGASVVANAMLGATLAVLPAFADGRGGAGAYGLVMSALAAGLFVGALVASRFDGVPYGRLSVGAFSVGAAAWFGALAVDWLPATVALFCLAHVPIGVTNVVGATLFQRLTPESMLGRATAVLGSASTAMMPLGALLGGAAGDAWGADAVMVAGGLGLVWIVVYVAAVPVLRRMPAATEVETIAWDESGTGSKAEPTGDSADDPPADATGAD